MNISSLGIDLAKNVFQLHGVAEGNAAFGPGDERTVVGDAGIVRQRDILRVHEFHAAADPHIPAHVPQQTGVVLLTSCRGLRRIHLHEDGAMIRLQFLRRQVIECVGEECCHCAALSSSLSSSNQPNGLHFSWYFILAMPVFGSRSTGSQR